MSENTNIPGGPPNRVPPQPPQRPMGPPPGQNVPGASPMPRPPQGPPPNPNMPRPAGQPVPPAQPAKPAQQPQAGPTPKPASTPQPAPAPKQPQRDVREKKPVEEKVKKVKEPKKSRESHKKDKNVDLFEDSLAKAGKIARRKTIKAVAIIVSLLLFIGGGGAAFFLLFNNLGYQDYEYRLNVSLSQPTTFTTTSTVIDPGGLVGIESPIAVFVPQNEEDSKIKNSYACFALSISFDKITDTGAKVNLNNLFSVQIMNSEKLYALEDYNYKEIGNKEFIEVQEEELIFYNTVLGAGESPFETIAGFMLKGNGNIEEDNDEFNHNAYAGDIVEITITVYSAYPSRDSIQNGTIGNYNIDAPAEWITFVENERAIKERAESAA